MTVEEEGRRAWGHGAGVYGSGGGRHVGGCGGEHMAWDGTQGTCGVVVRRWRYALLGTLLHTHTLTHTDIGHDTVWYVHTVERGLSVAGTHSGAWGGRWCTWTHALAVSVVGAWVVRTTHRHTDRLFQGACGQCIYM